MLEQKPARELRGGCPLLDAEILNHAGEQIADPVLQRLPVGLGDGGEAMAEQGGITAVEETLEFSPLPGIEAAEATISFALVALHFIALQPAIESNHAGVWENLSVGECQLTLRQSGTEASWSSRRM